MANKPRRILVVEDGSIVQLDIQNSLERLGYMVVATASTGADAVAKASDHRPDLVLMDVILKGGMDGIQASEEISTRHYGQGYLFSKPVDCPKAEALLTGKPPWLAAIQSDEHHPAAIATGRA